MKKILLLSDTHGHVDERMMAYAEAADEIWHAGDIGDLKVTDALANIKPLRAVYGNIDGAAARIQFPENNDFSLEGVRFLSRILVVRQENTPKGYVAFGAAPTRCVYMWALAYFESHANKRTVAITHQPRCCWGPRISSNAYNASL